MTLNRIYLNESSKKFYAQCLNEEIELDNINRSIVKHLLAISQSDNVRPIFSKKGNDSIYKRKLHSFLRIAFTKEAEKKLFNQVIPYFEKKYGNNNEYLFKWNEIKPYKNIARNITDYNKGAKWLVDSEYFNVSQIIFELKKGNEEIHNKFWNELKSKLSLV
jgi:hypothetical protein